MKKINAHWIPHKLNEQQKSRRKIDCMEMLRILTEDPSVFIVLTGDETWINWDNSFKAMWLLENEKPPDVVKKNISSRKTMISVIWGMNGIVSVVGLPTGQTFTKGFFVNNVLHDLDQQISARYLHSEPQRIFLHIDNARPHLANSEIQQLNIKRMIHHPTVQSWLLVTSCLDTLRCFYKARHSLLMMKSYKKCGMFLMELKLKLSTLHIYIGSSVKGCVLN